MRKIEQAIYVAGMILAAGLTIFILVMTLVAWQETHINIMRGSAVWGLLVSVIFGVSSFLRYRVSRKKEEAEAKMNLKTRQ